MKFSKDVKNVEIVFNFKSRDVAEAFARKIFDEGCVLSDKMRKDADNNGFKKSIKLKVNCHDTCVIVTGNKGFIKYLTKVYDD